MYTIYALQFEDKDVYVGMTDNLKRRIREHKIGKTKSTKGRKIIRIFKIEERKTRTEAREREKYWKSGCGKEFLKSWAISSVG